MAAQPTLQKAIELSGTHGSAWAAAAFSCLGLCLARCGALDDGLRYLERAATTQESSGVRCNLPQFFTYWAEGLWLAGDGQAALAKARHARQLAYASGERAHEVRAICLLGEFSDVATPSAPDSARELLDDAVRAAERLEMRPLVARFHLGLGKLYRRTDKGPEAREHLTTATAMYREMGMVFWLEQAESEMAALR